MSTLRDEQRPLKERYRADPRTARITLTARGSQLDVPTSCSVDLGRAIQEIEAHEGVGGPGTGACSGDVLLAALAGCAQVTCQMVAAAMGLEATRIEATAEGELDLRGTLGIDPEAPVGFDRIRLFIEVDAPGASAEEVAKLRDRTERYCVVMQTLARPPVLDMELVAG